jgi:hypothetical protein
MELAVGLSMGIAMDIPANLLETIVEFLGLTSGKVWEEMMPPREWEKELISGINPLEMAVKFFKLDISAQELKEQIIEANFDRKHLQTIIEVLNRLTPDYAPWDSSQPIPADWFDPYLEGGQLIPVNLVANLFEDTPASLLDTLKPMAPIPVEDVVHDLHSPDAEMICRFVMENLADSPVEEIAKELEDVGSPATPNLIKQCIKQSKKQISNYIAEIIRHYSDTVEGASTKDIKDELSRRDIELSEHRITGYIQTGKLSNISYVGGKFVTSQTKNTLVRSAPSIQAPPSIHKLKFIKRPNSSLYTKIFEKLRLPVSLTIDADVVEYINKHRFGNMSAGNFIGNQNIQELFENNIDISSWFLIFLHQKVVAFLNDRVRRKHDTFTITTSTNIGWAEYLDLFYINELGLHTSNASPLKPRHVPATGASQVINSYKIIADKKLKGDSLYAPVENHLTIDVTLVRRSGSRRSPERISVYIENVYPGNSIGDVRSGDTCIPKIAFFDFATPGEDLASKPMTELLSAHKDKLKQDLLEHRSRRLSFNSFKHTELCKSTLREVQRTITATGDLELLGINLETRESRLSYMSIINFKPNVLNYILRRTRVFSTTSPNKWLPVSDVADSFSFENAAVLINTLREWEELEIRDRDKRGEPTPAYVKYRDPFITCVPAESKILAAIDFAITETGEQPSRKEYLKLSTLSKTALYEALLEICDVGTIARPPQFTIQKLESSIDLYELTVNTSEQTLYSILFKDQRDGLLHILSVNSMFYGISNRNEKIRTATQRLESQLSRNLYVQKRKYLRRRNV